MGVPAQKRQDIFQEFVQAEPSHARKWSAAMAWSLAIFKRLVDADGRRDRAGAGAGRRLVLLVHPAGGNYANPRPKKKKPLAGKRVAIVTRNKPLRDGLSAQVNAAGGEAIEFKPLGRQWADRCHPDRRRHETRSDPSHPAGIRHSRAGAAHACGPRASWMALKATGFDGLSWSSRCAKSRCGRDCGSASRAPG